MPSPIAHGAVVLILRAIVARQDRLRLAVRARPAFLYAAAVGTLLAPDIDFLLERVFHYRVLWHGGATHSLVVGILFGLLFVVLCRSWYGAAFPWRAGSLVGIACAWSHPVMDMATWGRGVRVLWPFSSERYTTVTLFFGAHHAQPYAWKLHLITLVTELLFVAALWWLTRGFSRHTNGSAPRRRIGAPEGAAYGE
jgi:membrane-bound metal-dependent hydrolase YbcI (DUF457 family)